MSVFNGEFSKNFYCVLSVSSRACIARALSGSSSITDFKSIFYSIKMNNNHVNTFIVRDGVKIWRTKWANSKGSRPLPWPCNDWFLSCKAFLLIIPAGLFRYSLHPWISYLSYASNSNRFFFRHVPFTQLLCKCTWSDIFYIFPYLVPQHNKSFTLLGFHTITSPIIFYTGC